MTETGARPAYTPQEAAALAGVRLQRIQNAITAGRLGRAARTGRSGRRGIDLPGVLAFAAADRLGRVRVAPATLYAAFRRTGLPRGPIAITDAVTIDAPRLLGSVVRNVELYDRAGDRIVCDPAVMGGVPVVKGTRIPVRTLHARIKGGDPIEAVLEEYPYLDRDTVEIAVLYAEANPERGRPRRKASGKRA